VMVRSRKLVVLAGVAAAAVAVLRHGRRPAQGYRVAGGILISHAGVYDTLSRFLLGPFYRRIAADVAAVAPAGARVLEVGCGPGHLSNRLAHHHGLEVTGLDLDPAMIEPPPPPTVPATATSTGRRSWSATWPRWRSPADPSTWSSAPCRCTTGPTRRPVWPRSAVSCALAPGRWSGTSGARPHLFGPRHAQMPHSVQYSGGSPLRVVQATPWPWPWRFILVQRIELVRADGSPS
jgi:Methyltransferase domain